MVILPMHHIMHADFNSHVQNCNIEGFTGLEQTIPHLELSTELLEVLPRLPAQLHIRKAHKPINPSERPLLCSPMEPISKFFQHYCWPSSRFLTERWSVLAFSFRVLFRLAILMTSGLFTSMVSWANMPFTLYTARRVASFSL